MMQRHTSRHILAALLASSILLVQSLQGKSNIAAVHNRSAASAEIAWEDGSQSFAAHTAQTLRLPFIIPFVSVEKYRDAFIAGEPYFPKEALIITTSEGRYAIWQDEIGIVGAHEYVPGLTQEECIPVTLFKPQESGHANTVIWSIALLLTINHQGNVSVAQKT